MFSEATKESAKDVKKDFKSTLYNARRDIENAAADPSNDELEVMANNAGRKVRGLIDEASENLGSATDKVTAEIKANPMRSTLIALGVGYVLSMLLRA